MPDLFFFQSSGCPAPRCDLEPTHERLLIGFMFAYKGSRTLQQHGESKSFPITKDLIHSVQRQLKTLIDRKDAYNVQSLQDQNTFRWSRITLLRDPGAKLIRMKVDVFSDSILCVGVSNPDPSNNWSTKLQDVLEQTWICRKFEFGSPRSAIHFARITRYFNH